MKDRDDTATGLRRRALLQTAGTGALATGLSGCMGLLSGDGESPPTDTATGTQVGTSTDAPDDDGTGDGGGSSDGDCFAAPAADGPVEALSDDVRSDTTLSGRYEVTESVSVTNGATLTIEPGTVLTFAQDTGLEVVDDGRLSAVGTCSAPIVFSGEQETPGYWYGLRFDESNQRNELAFALIEYGGGDAYTWSNGAANVVASRGARLSVSNSSLHGSAAFGFAFGGGVSVDAFDGNAVTENADGAGRVGTTTAGALSDTSTYVGNEADVVEVDDGRVTDEVTWDGIDAPYRVRSGATVSVDGGHLTVAPGATVEFGQNAGLQVLEDGQLTAVGVTADEESRPITFTGEQKTRGYWNGIRFDEADRVTSRLQNVVVEYGGGDAYTWSNAAANVVLSRGARLAVTDATIRESAAYGVSATGDTTVEAFHAVTVTGNESGAGYVDARVAHLFSDTGTYVGNDEDVVVVSQGTVRSGQEVTWDGIDVPYRVRPESTVTVEGHLTVAPGATVEFGQSSRLSVEDGSGTGRLTAVGLTDDEERRPITFTGEQKTRGYWNGIRFDETDRTENQLRNCVVEYGGGDAYTWSNAAANVVLSRGSRLRVDGSTVRESGSYGVAVTGDSTVDSFTTNTVTRNRDGAAKAAAPSAHYFSDTSTYTGNDRDVLLVTSGTVRDGRRVTWDAIDVPYRVASDDTVSVQGRLTVDPGTTVEFGQNADLEAVAGSGVGSITAVGESDALITFTGEQKTAGYWNGLRFDETSRTENRLHHCVVEYGGREQHVWADAAANVAVSRGSRLSLQDSTVRDSVAYGVSVTSDSTLDAAGNTYANNPLGDIE
ncbi:hypothetical protein [Haloarchaeobius sp. HRN-SO-5]|uniref:hypothetical protein n=1 Tax=Haloarchaeobius sp. HRN-SO-5 TaxID=3446118 RepID=UPI003EBC0E03